MSKQVSKFPLCSKYGLLFQGEGNGDWIYISYEARLSMDDLEKVELALECQARDILAAQAKIISKAYENGMLEGYKQGEEKRIELRRQLTNSRRFLGKKDRRIQKLKAELK